MNKYAPNKFYDYQDLSELMGVSKRTLRNWVDEKRLRAIQLGPKSVRFDPADVQSFIENAKSSSPENTTKEP